MKLGAFDYLQKPVSSPTAIRELVAGALERRVKLAAPSLHELASPVRLTFGAPAMIPVVDALARVAKTTATVLLAGESGTGKEVAARLLHESGPRALKPFIAINCAVLTEQLLESELFGHEKGAFTGAHAQRRGRIELADGGTFFLDEVGELKPSLQAKLLRVLEERRFERLGGSVPVAVDVRWVAATNRDLRSMTASPCFRSACLRFASGVTTSSPWQSRSSRGSRRPPAVPRSLAWTTPRRHACGARTGPETCANSVTCSSAR